MELHSRKDVQTRRIEHFSEGNLQRKNPSENGPGIYAKWRLSFQRNKLPIGDPWIHKEVDTLKTKTGNL